MQIMATRGLAPLNAGAQRRFRSLRRDRRKSSVVYISPFDMLARGSERGDWLAVSGSLRNWLMGGGCIGSQVAGLGGS
jgi:hypothetical protein